MNIHKGLFKYNRLPFGVSFAVGIFQNTIERVIQGQPGVFAYLHDVLVAEKKKKEHNDNLLALLKRFREHGIRLKRSKFIMTKPSLEYVGLVVDAAGVKPSPKKLDALLNVPIPKCVDDLRSYLGMVNYYSKYIPNLANTAAPLYALLQKDASWYWSPACDIIYKTLQAAITSNSTLVQYNSALPLVLECDASSNGVGAALHHIMPDGNKRPIAFALKSLSTSEKQYSQIEKERLAIIYAVKKFHRFLHGRHFTLVTDHKPLLMVLGPKGHKNLVGRRIKYFSV